MATKYDTLFKCHLCNKVFTSESALTHHVKYGAGDRQFKCCVCRLIFRTNFEEHQATHEPSGKKRKLSSDKKTKNESPAKKKILRCTSCPRIFYDQKSLKEHVKENHEKKIDFGNIVVKDMAFTCDKCGAPFMREENKLSHMHRCKVVKPKKDSPKKSKTEDSKKKSPKSSKLKEGRHSKRIIAQHDSSSSENEDSDQEEKKSHSKKASTLSIDMPFTCDGCSAPFAKEENKNNHMRFCKAAKSESKPVITKTYDCSFCNKIFTSETVLRDHEQIHRGNQRTRRILSSSDSDEDKSKKEQKGSKRKIDSSIAIDMKFSCKSCGAPFMRKENLKIHMSRCNVENPNKDDLKKDKKSPKHDSKNDNKPPISDPKKNDLKKLKIAEVKRSYDCRHCSKKFMFQSHLERHEEECRRKKRGLRKTKKKKVPTATLR